MLKTYIFFILETMTAYN